MSKTDGNWGYRQSLILLRILIGWHFLYEGVIKLYNPDWTSFGYLASAQGPLKPFFVFLASPELISWVDSLNWLALVFTGLTLLLGIFERAGALAGMLLLGLYYLAHPSFPWLDQLNVEGSYWFVNKNLIELVACSLLYLQPTGSYFGLERILFKKSSTTKTELS